MDVIVSSRTAYLRSGVLRTLCVFYRYVCNYQLPSVRRQRVEAMCATSVQVLKTI
jgi:hypothetical protein